MTCATWDGLVTLAGDKHMVICSVQLGSGIVSGDSRFNRPKPLYEPRPGSFKVIMNHQSRSGKESQS